MQLSPSSTSQTFHLLKLKLCPHWVLTLYTPSPLPSPRPLAIPAYLLTVRIWLLVPRMSGIKSWKDLPVASLGEATPHSPLQPLLTACTAHTPASHQPQAWLSAPALSALCLHCSPFSFTVPNPGHLTLPQYTELFPVRGVCECYLHSWNGPHLLLTWPSPAALQTPSTVPLRASSPSTNLMEAHAPTVKPWLDKGLFSVVLWFLTSLIFSSSILL